MPVTASIVRWTRGVDTDHFRPRDVRPAIEATYYYPYQLHGSMGPSCAIADVQGNEVTVWSPTQGVYPLRQAVAGMLGIPQQNVHVIYKEGSGCYGLNGADTASLDAVLLSRAVGKPVRLQWMREDEHVWEHMGTPMVMGRRTFGSSVSCRCSSCSRGPSPPPHKPRTAIASGATTSGRTDSGPSPRRAPRG